MEAGRFRQAIDLLWPNREKLDDPAAVQLAIALEKRGRQKDAIDLLAQRKGSHTDAMGTLAGRLKRRWLRERIKSDAERASDLYRQAYQLSKDTDPHQAYYHAINLAFMELAFRRNYAEVKLWAHRALDHSAAAAGKLGDARAWRFATEGEANLLLGEIDTAMLRYRDAIAEHPNPWQLESMFLQALEVARQLEDTTLAERLANVFGTPLV